MTHIQNILGGQLGPVWERAVHYGYMLRGLWAGEEEIEERAHILFV